MAGTLLIIGGILLGQAGAETADLGLEVRRLVRQLNAPRLADRNAAEERLTGLGPGVLVHLPSPDDNAPAEVQQRVGRIRQTLQQKLAREAAQSSTITLHGSRPLGQVLAAFQEQTGNQITGMSGFDPMAVEQAVEVDFQAAPFWPALDEVLDKAGLTAYSYGREKAITLRPRTDSQAPRVGRASYGGPFRFAPVQIEAARDLRNTDVKSLHVVLEVAWEPRLAPISLLVPLGRIEAVDENGDRLPVDGGQAELEVPITADATATDLRIPLVLPPRSVRQIARLKGSLTALLPGKIETFRFKDLENAKQVEQRIAGVTVVFEGARKNNEAWEVRLRIRFDDAGGALQSHRGWIFDNEVYLEGPDGKPIAWSTYETTRQTENELGIAYLFGVESLRAHTLVYKTPGVILTAEIPYELQAIPLP